MADIRHLLVAYDHLSLSVLLTISSREQELVSVRVHDRFGVLIREQKLKSPAEDLLLKEMPRGRFPLKVEVKDSAGALSHLGPLYPAPTDTPEPGAVPLPIAAVDVDNDPELRKLRSDIRRGQAFAVGHRRSERLLDMEARSSLENLRSIVFSVLIVAVGIAASTGPEKSSITPALLGFVVLILGFMGWRVSRRLKDIQRRSESLAKRQADAVRPFKQARQRLTQLGLAHLTIPSSGSSCGCGTGGCGGNTSDNHETVEVAQ
ncbi:hypothetical protein [Microbulbifer sp. TYP-18]|uniref:hypothetical protein n=1 Tax=Microbulbifer sp. TYP-18 TaxID=3230024 RepID=UPI0034C646DB